MERNATTEAELIEAVESLEIVGQSITDIKVRCVVDQVSSEEERATEQEYGFITDGPVILTLSDGRVLSVYASSVESTYCGFNFEFDPVIDDECQNDLNANEFFKDVLGKKIVDYKIQKSFDSSLLAFSQNVTADSPSELSLLLEDGTELVFNNPIMDGFMDCAVRLAN